MFERNCRVELIWRVNYLGVWQPGGGLTESRLPGRHAALVDHHSRQVARFRHAVDQGCCGLRHAEGANPDHPDSGPFAPSVVNRKSVRLCQMRGARCKLRASRNVPVLASGVIPLHLPQQAQGMRFGSTEQLARSSSRRSADRQCPCCPPSKSAAGTRKQVSA